MNTLTTEHTPDNIIASWLDDHQEELVNTADYIFHHPELAYQETLSSKCLADYLESQGFKITWKTAGIDTAFTAVWGGGKPILGFLAEYDALAGVGHACGHNLLGTAVAAAACALKADMETTGAAGTICVYGCPAEEIMSGKIVMNDQGVFDDLDVAITWHPFDRNRVSNDIWQAQDIKNYTFHGLSSHAAKAPEKGRSALDALELMNVGVQFLREHVPLDTRIHYAITNTGGAAPGTVQPYAEGLYLLRAVQLPQVKDLYRRVNLIAQGAAMMTETQVDIEFIKACSNMVLNSELNQVMQRNLSEVPPADFDEDDLDLARQFRQTIPARPSYFDSLAAEVTDPEERARLDQEADAPIHRLVMPLAQERQGFVSSDVGDVSWNCPVAQINAATMPAGLAMHSWQMVAVGKTPMAKKGMLYAAKVMAGSAIDALENPSILQRAKEEFLRRTGGQAYESPIPPQVNPKVP